MAAVDHDDPLVIAEAPGVLSTGIGSGAGVNSPLVVTGSMCTHIITTIGEPRRRFLSQKASPTASNAMVRGTKPSKSRRPCR